MKNEMKKYLPMAIVFTVAVAVIYIFTHNISGISHFIGLLIEAVKPFLIGCIIAYVVNILMRRYEKWYFPKSQKAIVTKTRRLVCMLLAFGTIVLILFLVIKVVVPQVVLCVSMIANEVPRAAERAYDWIMQNEELKGFFNNVIKSEDIDWKNIITSIKDMVIAGAGGVMNAVISVISVTVSMVVQIVLGLIFAIYLLFGKERLIGQVKKCFRAYTSENVRKKVSYVLRVADKTFSSFVVGQCTEAVILGTLCAIGMQILGLPYAGMVGAVIGITALVPVVGAYIGGGLGAFMICTVSPVDAVVFVVFLVILQQLEGNLIYPRVVGNSIGLPGVWVLFTVTICGGLWGILGMLLGVPAVATCYKLLKADVNRRTQAAVPVSVSAPEPEETQEAPVEAPAE